MAERQWYEVYSNVVAVARYLVEEEGWDAHQLLHFLGKPWKWGEKWEEIQRRKK